MPRRGSRRHARPVLRHEVADRDRVVVEVGSGDPLHVVESDGADPLEVVEVEAPVSARDGLRQPRGHLGRRVAVVGGLRLHLHPRPLQLDLVQAISGDGRQSSRMIASTSSWAAAGLSVANTWNRPGSRSCQATACTSRHAPVSTSRWWRREVTPPVSASASTARAWVSGCAAAGTRHEHDPADLAGAADDEAPLALLGRLLRDTAGRAGRPGQRAEVRATSSSASSRSKAPTRTSVALSG